ncbi:nuclear protein 1 [Adelges cooleyi]|uniref:nuclear protein 1 n=1 Tax=Adelges cooleyi TaxID=133065 RepID=UPI00217FAE7D|nr:nuclear protein 1 [Adelges cooleyi]
MSSTEVDDYEEYNYDQDKLVNSGHSGKNRSKKEASEHTNHSDPNGHTRKLLTKLQNTETHKKEENVKPHPTTKK